MRDRFFSMYQCIKYKECFYGSHRENAQKMYNAYSTITLAVSIISVLIWSISKSMPALWAIVIAVAQFAQACGSKLLWSSQLTSLKYLMPELAKLCLNIDHDWLALDLNNYSDEKILKLISMYEDRFEVLQKQFTDGISFHEKAAILKKAEMDQRNYFYARYPIIKEMEGVK